MVDKFFYETGGLHAFRIDSISPAHGPAWSYVTIGGEWLHHVAAVRIGGVLSPRVIHDSRNSIRVRVPDGTVGSTVDVTFESDEDEPDFVSQNAFTYDADADATATWADIETNLPTWADWHAVGSWSAIEHAGS